MTNINNLPPDLRDEAKRHREGTVEVIDFDRSSGEKGYIVLFHSTGRFGLCLNGQSEFGRICDYRLFLDDWESYFPGWYISVNSLRWENGGSGESFSIDPMEALKEAREVGMRWSRTIENYKSVKHYRAFERFCTDNPTFPNTPYCELHAAAIEGAWEELE